MTDERDRGLDDTQALRRAPTMPIICAGHEDRVRPVAQTDRARARHPQALTASERTGVLAPSQAVAPAEAARRDSGLANLAVRSGGPGLKVLTTKPRMLGSVSEAEDVVQKAPRG